MVTIFRQSQLNALLTGLGNKGLKITAGQRTMSSLITDLTGQTLILPVILTGHFWIRIFYFPYSCRLMLQET